MSRFAFPDLVRAFRDGERFGDATIRVAEVGPLVLPTGRIVACDPCYLTTSNCREPAYTRAVPPGRYPLLLALLSNPRLPLSSPNYERVACVMVRFRDVPVKQWEMALQPGWDSSTLKPGYHFGYGVDGGTGCFLDEGTAALIPGEQPAYYEAMHRVRRIEDLLEAPQLLVPPAFGELMASGHCRVNKGGGHPARSAVLDPATGANIVCFPSGYGDGCYASYFGLAADGSAACLVTDFDLLVRSVMDKLEIPVPAQEHSELAHPDLAHPGVERIWVDWNPATGEVTIQAGEAPYLQSLRFENRPGQGLASTSQGNTYWYRLGEPLHPTARVIVEYTLRTEAL